MINITPSNLGFDKGLRSSMGVGTKYKMDSNKIITAKI